MTLATMSERLGIPLGTDLTELDKCLAHYAARELIADLWSFSEPTISSFIDPKGRFNLDKAITEGTLPPISPDITENLEAGCNFLFKTNDNLFEKWASGFDKRAREDRNGKDGVLFKISKSYAIIVNKGDLGASSALEATFLSAGRENFDWVRDYPDMSREELEEIVEHSRIEHLRIASQFSMKSVVREDAVIAATKRGELGYIFDLSKEKDNLKPCVA
jgi:hypothetical protein